MTDSQPNPDDPDDQPADELYAVLPARSDEFERPVVVTRQI